MDSLYFTSDERAFFERVIREGFLQERRGVYWWVVRLAVAQSLRLEDLPDERYRAPGGTERSELHLEQVTGQGKSPDFDPAMRMMLSVRHQEDLFEDNRRYLELLQHHARRGLAAMEAGWRPGRNFHDYLLAELYSGLDVPDAGDASGGGGALEVPALLQGLKQIDVSAAIAAEPREGPRLTRFSLTLAGVDDYERLRRGLDDLTFALGLGSTALTLSRDQGERRVILDVPRPMTTWRDVRWADVRAALEGRREQLPVSPGVDILGKPVIFDLTEAPHLFVAGTTGSGKSVCLNALILSLLASARPPEILMIDPKGLDFGDYNGCSLLRGRAVITDMDAAVEALRATVEEMETRQALLREHNARNLAEAQAAGARIERLVVVIDELADFMMGKAGAEEPLIRLAQKARASGIHLVLATQRVEAATFPGLLRANIPSRIALTVQKQTDSRIILDEGGAETLLMRGDMLVKLAGRDALRAHGARVEPSDIRAALAEVNRR